MQFEAHLKESVLCHTPYFSLRWRKNAPEKPFSFAAVVSKKAIKTAVGRNLIKRRVRAIAEEVFKARKSHWPVSVVVFLKKEGTELAFSKLKGELQAVFSKI